MKISVILEVLQQLKPTILTINLKINCIYLIEALHPFAYYSMKLKKELIN